MENKATELRDFEKWLKGSIYSNKRTFEIIEIFKQSLNSNEPDEARAVGKHEQKEKFCHNNNLHKIFIERGHNYCHWCGKKLAK